mgnify:CR=1 FL=1
MSRKPPAFQFYASDFFSGVADMTDAEVGIYIRLLCLSWDKGGLSERQLPSASHEGDEAAVRSVLKWKFHRDEDGLWRNARLEETRQVQLARSQAGRKGGQTTQANFKQTGKQTPSKLQAKAQANRQANGQAKSKPQSQSHSQSQSSVSNSEKERRRPARKLAPPRLEEVREYCRSRDSAVDPEQFCDHYAANGWRQANGNPIKDWRAAVRTWERNEFGRKRSEELAAAEQAKPKPKPLTASHARYLLVKEFQVKQARDWPDDRCLEEYRKRLVKSPPEAVNNPP